MTRTMKSMTGIAHDLATNREEKAMARKHYVVVSLTSKGTPSKYDTATLRYNGTVTLEQAEARKAIMEHLNPDRRYTIVTR